MVDWGFLRDPKLRKIVTKALKYVREREAKGYSLDFELSDIGVPWWEFRKLIYDYELFKVGYKSRSQTRYEFTVPLDEVERRLNEAEMLFGEDSTPRIQEEGKYIDIPPDFWEIVEGYDDIKEIFIASLKADKPCHILLVGGPATGKSIMLMEVGRLSESIFITAGTATKVGIRDVLLNYKPRILIIDELDKISSPDDISVLLTLMESGRVVVAKHKEYKEETMKTWVFAAANTTKKLPPELLDRFQIFHLKPYDPETLRRVIKKTLVKREGVSEDLAEYIAHVVVQGNGSVREAIRLSRISKTKDDVDKYYKIMKKYREM
ncbi:MAG TPA: AAA family ATPase [Sulfolobales archaeon]|nr:AAA family ATPase [Sulfolobales archaeon]